MSRIKYLGQVGLLVLCCASLLVIASAKLPDAQAEKPALSCALKENCWTGIFDTDGTGTRLAYCVTWGDNEWLCWTINDQRKI